MREVTIEKTKLVERVTKNRDQHRAVFEKAIDGYRQAAAAFFEEQLDKAREGKQFSTVFNEPVPEDHTEDYEAALDMLDMGTENTIKLTAQEFRQYVRDDWGWKRDWVATTSNYLVNA